MTYKLHLEGEYYNYITKEQISHNQKYLDYIFTFRNIFIYSFIILLEHLNLFYLLYRFLFSQYK